MKIWFLDHLQGRLPLGRVFWLHGMALRLLMYASLSAIGLSTRPWFWFLIPLLLLDLSLFVWQLIGFFQKWRCLCPPAWKRRLHLGWILFFCSDRSIFSYPLVGPDTVIPGYSGGGVVLRKNGSASSISLPASSLGRWYHPPVSG